MLRKPRASAYGRMRGKRWLKTRARDVSYPYGSVTRERGTDKSQSQDKGLVSISTCVPEDVEAVGWCCCCCGWFNWTLPPYPIYTSTHRKRWTAHIHHCEAPAAVAEVAPCSLAAACWAAASEGYTCEAKRVQTVFAGEDRFSVNHGTTSCVQRTKSCLRWNGIRAHLDQLEHEKRAEPPLVDRQSVRQDRARRLAHDVGALDAFPTVLSLLKVPQQVDKRVAHVFLIRKLGSATSKTALLATSFTGYHFTTWSHLWCSPTRPEIPGLKLLHMLHSDRRSQLTLPHLIKELLHRLFFRIIHQTQHTYCKSSLQAESPGRPLESVTPLFLSLSPQNPSGRGV
ncbi:hypothetical protein PsorP6_012224 [Peronosclerospora sorghi]|uniref:Uncharacterized protein n=1 Tax=Peronosclerospora sorghi TaxID=230839 RepID=A0ACC0WL69_9STRA|nr:hypothetical protein PsorP6_012224 [Peronosclerospora sorghi]